MEGRAAAGGTLDFELAAVDFGDDAVNDRQAEAGAAGFGGEERLEEAGALFLGHANAGVGESKKEEGGRKKRRADSECAAVGHRVHGVEDEVEAGLLDLRAVGADSRQVGGELGAQRDLVLREFVAGQQQRVFEERVDVERLEARFAGAREAQQPVHDPVEVIHFLSDDLGVARARVGGVEAQVE